MGNSHSLGSSERSHHHHHHDDLSMFLDNEHNCDDHLDYRRHTRHRAARAATIYCLTRFFVGDSLDSITDHLSRHGTCASEEVFRESLLDTCQNLMGCAGSSETYSLMDENDTETLTTTTTASESKIKNKSHHRYYRRLRRRQDRGTPEGSISSEPWILFFKVFLAVYMNQYERAESLLCQLKRNINDAVVPLLAQNYIVFYEGLVAAVLAFRSKGRINRRQLCLAQKKLKTLKVEKVEQDPTFWNKVFLLDAQIHACLGQIENALLLFHKSVDLAEQEGFSHEQGLAYELAWRMCEACRRPVEAELYLCQARTFYEQWGAHAKVDQLGQ